MRPQKNNPSLLEKMLFYSLVFFLPSQLGYHFWPNYALIFGIRVDYLSPTVYFTDLLIGALVTFFLLRNKKSLLDFLKKYRYLFLGLLAFLFLNTYLSKAPWVTFLKWMKFLEVFLLSFYVSQNFNLIKNKAFTKILSISLLLISILGISQFFLARTVNGPFYFLGERSFNISTPGIALQTIKGVDHLRSYSSFSHPNSLAGYLFVSLAILFWLKKEIKLKSKEKLLINISMMFSLISLVLTFSLSALFGGVVFIALLFISKKQSLFEKIFKSSLFVVVMLSISLPFIAGNVTKTNFPKQVEERVGLARVSWKMFLEKPLIGSGLNTFVVNLPNIQNRSSYFWFFQPVHNTILLILSEIGLFGFLLFLYIFNKTQISIIANKNYLIGALLISVMTIGLFDHYFLTLQQNLLSLAFVFGNAFTHKKA